MGLGVGGWWSPLLLLLLLLLLLVLWLFGDGMRLGFCPSRGFGEFSIDGSVCLRDSQREKRKKVEEKKKKKKKKKKKM